MVGRRAKKLEQIDEVARARLWEPIGGLGYSHAAGGVHRRDLTFGSGSYDGVFGMTVNARWRRLFGNAQFSILPADRGGVRLRIRR
jgi:hypothetical protein